MVRTVAVGFDGVIHSYDKGWQDGTIYGDLIPGANDGLRWLMNDYAVFIHTTRETSSVAKWTEDKTGISCVPQVNPFIEFWNAQGEILVTNIKLPAVAYIDDRAVRFVNWDKTIRYMAERQT